MGRKKLYKNAAEKQRAWRIKHGQKRKVPLPLRRGERLGASESEIRAKREDETWQQYSIFLKGMVQAARKRQQAAGGAVTGIDDKEHSTGAKRTTTPYHEPEMGEDYYERRQAYEASMDAPKGKKFEGTRR